MGETTEWGKPLDKPVEIIGAQVITDDVIEGIGRIMKVVYRGSTVLRVEVIGNEDGSFKGVGDRTLTPVKLNPKKKYRLTEMAPGWRPGMEKWWE